MRVVIPSGETVLIDDQDSDLINIFPYWRMAGTGNNGRVLITRYLKNEYGRVRQDVYLARAIVKPNGSMEVDHKDRDPLNNTRANLRLATRAQNSVNKRKAKNLTSKYRGVSWKGNRNKKNPWLAYIVKNKKQITAGYHKTEELAAKAYDKKAKEVWGEFAQQNFEPEGSTG